jgi:uncharacterized protein (DUF1697 family)
MQRYVALLRGIAPSGRNMTNDKLRGVFEELGFADVGSVLASGNITFSSDGTDEPALERRIEEALAGRLEVTSTTILRAYPELRTLVDSDPFPGLTHGRGSYLTATFLKEPAADPGVVREQTDPHTRVVRYDRSTRAVLAVTDDTGDGPSFMAWLEKAFGKGITTRSWLTVQRIVRKLET